MKDESAKADALVEAARAEIAAKRKMRETRFADTVLGWENEEEAAQEAFPATVVGWDHPAARTMKGLDGRLGALIAEEKALTAAQQQRARRWVYGLIAAVIVAAGLFIVSSLL